jgi:hypothetical protein
VIDLSYENAISFEHASELPELKRDGRSPCAHTLRRWALRGVRQVRLESVCVRGRGRVTTAEAVRRFLAALNGASEAARQGNAQKDHRRAQELLRAAGI